MLNNKEKENELENIDRVKLRDLGSLILEAAEEYYGVDMVSTYGSMIKEECLSSIIENANILIKF